MAASAEDIIHELSRRLSEKHDEVQRLKDELDSAYRLLRVAAELFAEREKL